MSIRDRGAAVSISSRENNPLFTRMRTGPELILATKPYAKDEPLRSWWAILSTAGLMVMAVLGVIYGVHWAMQLGCSVLLGFLILRFFVIYHDQQHHAILPHSKLAEGLMWVFGLLSLSPSSIWRSSHNHHHAHNSKLRGAHIGSYPIMTKDQYLKSTPADRRLYLYMRHPLTMLFGYVFVFLVGMCLRPFWMKPREHWDCLVSLILHVSIGVALVWFQGWATWMLVQVLPHFLAHAMGSYLFYCQHNFTSVSFEDRAGWTYEKAALDSSSYMRTGRLMAWFTANIGYHHIHHLNSRIPFYKLPRVMKEIPELANPKETSLRPSEIWRCLRLKVWDVERKQLVPLGPEMGTTRRT